MWYLLYQFLSDLYDSWILMLKYVWHLNFIQLSQNFEVIFLIQTNKLHNNFNFFFQYHYCIM